jgi:hypothetical protein
VLGAARVARDAEGVKAKIAGSVLRVEDLLVRERLHDPEEHEDLPKVNNSAPAPPPSQPPSTDAFIATHSAPSLPPHSAPAPAPTRQPSQQREQPSLQHQTAQPPATPPSQPRPSTATDAATQRPYPRSHRLPAHATIVPAIPGANQATLYPPDQLSRACQPRGDSWLARGAPC